MTTRSLLAKELPGYGHELQYPGVLQAVKDLLGGAPGLNDVFVFEKVQMLGDTGLGGLNLPLKFLDRLFSLTQMMYKVKTGGMGQNPQASGRFFQALWGNFLKHHIIIL
jgi:hypothetical protein